MLIVLLVGLVVCSLGGTAVVEGRPVSSDLLTGREFLEVYMRRQPHYLRHNTIPHKDDEHYNELNDISSSSLDGDEISEEEDEDDEDEEEDSTSEQPELLTTISPEESDTTTTTDGPDTTVMETTRAERSTTEADLNPLEQPLQVVSVRVSSSVVRQKPEITDHRSQDEKKISVSYRVEAKATDSFPSASQTLEKFEVKPNSSYATAEALTYQRINLGSDPQNSPISYETSVSSATSDSSVRFYREPPRYEYRTDGSERQSRTFPDPIFGQRQKPFPKQDLYKTASRQTLTENERDFPSRDVLYRTTPARPYEKTEAVFVKTTEAFNKPSQDVYDKLNGDYNKQDQYPKDEQIFNKPQQIYSKSDDDVKTEQEFSKLSSQDDIYGRKNQPFANRQEFPERLNQREQELSTGSFTEAVTQEFGKKQEFQQQSFGKREPESQPSFDKPLLTNYPRREQKPERFYAEPEKVYGEQEKVYGEPEKVYGEPEKVYGEPEKVYGKPEKVYVEPEKIYGTQAKIYSQPEKIYSQPEKVYSQQEKVYSQPEKVYGQPEKVYSQPEKIYGEPEKIYSQPPKVFGQPEKVYGRPEKVYGEPEQNYEVEEAVSVRTDGRTHGVQPSSAKDDKHKFGYVVDGHNYRKYRVEERTPDGFIVGEYGVVSHDDGSLRGVRYTADSNINPRLIQDALLKFLSLK